MIRRALRPGWLCLVLWLLAGCGGGASSQSRGPGEHAETTPAAGATAQATHELPSPAPARERAAGATTATAAISAFARVYINWNAEDVSARMARLARASVGQARSEMSLAAAETRADTTLRQGGIANLGEVEAVAPVRGRPGVYVVVTREATTSSVTTAYQGLSPAWHLTLATVQAQGQGRGRHWVLSGWQPEN